jgi:hypothetical protein
MPSQEFYDILAMIIYPDVIEPNAIESDVLQDNTDASDQPRASASCKALTFVNISSN